MALPPFRGASYTIVPYDYKQVNWRGQWDFQNQQQNTNCRQKMTNAAVQCARKKQDVLNETQDM
jgi:hypothetical protein